MAKTYTKTRVKATEAMLLISKADRILAKDSRVWKLFHTGSGAQTNMNANEVIAHSTSGVHGPSSLT